MNRIRYPAQLLLKQVEVLIEKLVGGLSRRDPLICCIAAGQPHESLQRNRKVVEGSSAHEEQLFGTQNFGARQDLEYRLTDRLHLRPDGSWELPLDYRELARESAGYLTVRHRRAAVVGG